MSPVLGGQVGIPNKGGAPSIRLYSRSARAVSTNNNTMAAIPARSPKGRALWSDLKDKLQLDSSGSDPQSPILENPWTKHHLEDIPAQRIIHHLYDGDKGSWRQSEGFIKMQTEPWDNGAMRECFRVGDIENERSFDCSTD